MALAIVLVAMAMLGGWRAAAAETLAVAPGQLGAAIAAAAPGTVLTLQPGIHPGGVVIDKPLTLEGLPGAVVDGDGQGIVIKVASPDVTLRGLIVRNSGSELPEMHSAIFLDKTAQRAVVEGNRLEYNLIGVYIWGAKEAMVRNNVIIGRDDLRMSERGDGVSVWNAPGAAVVDNEIRLGRDGIFTNASKQNRFIGNRMTGLRFGIHYMYTNDSEVIGNVSTGNDVGFALMFSSRLDVRDNRSLGDRQHGIALNYANDSKFSGNAVLDGGEKCVFIYNANKNRFSGNVFRGCGIGVHFTAGSERNLISGNAFINNETQVKYVGTRYLDWSSEGSGNYWSDNPAFDLNGDGLADTPYRPNDLIDQVVWRIPVAKLLLNGPAVQVVRWAQSQFPAITPGGVVDTAPLMKPPHVAALEGR